MSGFENNAVDVTLSLWDKRALVFVNGELPDSTAEACIEACQYEKEGHSYTDAWQQGEWDGNVDLFRKTSSGNYAFPLGLLSKVCRILDLHGIAYEVEGVERPGRGDVEYEWPDSLTLREYQSDAVTDALNAGSGIISMPTGAGKTVVGLRLIHELQHPTVVFCHTKEIAEQWVERVRDRLGVEPARCFGGDRQEGTVTVALYQSLYDDGDVREHPALNHPLAIFDEVHVVGAKMFSEVALSSSAPFRYGLSATPERNDNATLRVVGGTGEFICNIDVEDLIDQGYLAEPNWRFLTPRRVEGRFRDWQSEYKAAIVENEYRNNLLAGEITNVPKPCLATVEQINHGERLTSKVESEGVDVSFIHGSASNIDEDIDAFRDGDLDVLISTRGIVGEGFDVPEIRSFVVAGGKKSRVSIIQQVGRALRPDTDEAVIVDVMDRGTSGYNSWVGEHAEERLRVYREYYGQYGPSNDAF